MNCMKFNPIFVLSLLMDRSLLKIYLISNKERSATNKFP